MQGPSQSLAVRPHSSGRKSKVRLWQPVWATRRWFLKTRTGRLGAHARGSWALTRGAFTPQVHWVDGGRPVLRLEVTSGAQAGHSFSLPPHLTVVRVYTSSRPEQHVRDVWLPADTPSVLVAPRS